ncbi:hypothetical protein ASPWEDRAFT_110012 [Aspergillus wentii DTO 134E9]|uniref:Spherulin 4-like cell surface protein n=1 Tax=Aspergillus wentii DTO 134E9 TaxID=1073089 RepID=A0A1L9RLW8_ASPWE|nr:uncharacterized protein ASPWEDRAFT_110012 [Aspergillus wentii DTO 134E9]KAI9929631.1 hypothetical protein MW887_001105 [Aspergillus wentii]OJJ35921.1 hypothetical protein ASPWEDRAFT_110012 [Aspergillus wentii DTO 134E9]
MYLRYPSFIIAAVLGYTSILSQQAYAAHIPARYHHGPGGRFHYGFSTSSLPASSVSVQPTPAKSTHASSTLISVATPSATPSRSPVSTNSTAKANVIIPFYLYPSEGAWTPLEKLIAANKDVEFTIIINPDNGPGSSSLPDDAFITEVPKLTAHSNALVLGYVPTGTGSRDISEVEQDIKRYAGWASASGNGSFAVQGVFLDEAPAEYSSDTVTYYQKLASLIKGSDGLGPENQVVMNPGTVPDTAYLDIPDLTVIFESPYSQFLEAVEANEFKSIKGVDSKKLASMVYDIPGTVDLSSLVQQLCDISGQTYLSNTNTYQAYDSLWGEVVSLLTA